MPTIVLIFDGLSTIASLNSSSPMIFVSLMELMKSLGNCALPSNRQQCGSTPFLNEVLSSWLQSGDCKGAASRHSNHQSDPMRSGVWLTTLETQAKHFGQMALMPKAAWRNEVSHGSNFTACARGETTR
jgi:hypothetical protein